MGDILGDIEQWRIAKRLGVRGSNEPGYTEIGGPPTPPGELVDVVRADAYRGAVEAEREALRFVLNMSQGDWDRTIPTLEQWAETRLRELGGQ